jgi:hypothetical protein
MKIDASRFTHCIVKYYARDYNKELALPNFVKYNGKVTEEVLMRLCPCGSGKASQWQYDARGIECCRTCEDCHQKKMSRYRKDVLIDPNYWADEPIEEDE